MFNQGTSKPEASHSENGDMAWACEELVELDDVQLASVVGGVGVPGVVSTGYSLTLMDLTLVITFDAGFTGGIGGLED